MVPSTTIVPVTAGASATDVINLSSVNGFSGTVNYTCTAASGLTCSLSPGSTAFTSGSSSSATLTIGANSSTTNGNYNVLITGTGPNGLFVHTLNITAVVSGNITSSGLTLSNSGAITVPAGLSGTSNHYRGGFRRLYRRCESLLRCHHQSRWRNERANLRLRTWNGRPHHRRTFLDLDLDRQHRRRHDTRKLRRYGHRNRCGNREDHGNHTRQRDGNCGSEHYSQRQPRVPDAQLRGLQLETPPSLPSRLRMVLPAASL